MVSGRAVAAIAAVGGAVAAGGYFLLTKASLGLSISRNSIVQGQGVTFTVVNATPGGVVTIFQDGNALVQIQANSAGVASYTYATVEQIGVLSFRAQDSSGRTSVTVVLTVAQSAPANVTVTPSATNILVGQPVTFQGVITDQAGVPFPNAPVYLFANSNAIESAGVTDANGAYTVSYVPPVIATYQFFIGVGTAGSPRSAVVTVTVSPSSTAVPVLSVSPTSVAQGQTILFTVTGATPGGTVWILLSSGGFQGAWAQLVADGAGNAQLVYPNVNTISYLNPGSYMITALDNSSGAVSNIVFLAVS